MNTSTNTNINKATHITTKAQREILRQSRVIRVVDVFSQFNLTDIELVEVDPVNLKVILKRKQEGTIIVTPYEVKMESARLSRGEVTLVYRLQKELSY